MTVMMIRRETADSTRNVNCLLLLKRGFPRLQQDLADESATCGLQAATSRCSRALRLPAVQCRTPGQTAAKTTHQEYVTGLDAACLLSLIEADRD